MQLNNNERAYKKASAYWAIYDGLTSAFVIAYALMFGPTNFLIGLLGGIPALATMLAEAFGARMTQRWSRVSIVVSTYAIDKSMWAGIIFAPLFFPQRGFWLLMFFYFLNQFFVALRDPALTSLIGQSVPKAEKGRYFAQVNKLQVSIGLVAILVAGAWLDYAGKTNALSYVFMFLAASVFGFIAMGQLSRMREMPMREQKFTLLDAFRVDGEFRRFVMRAGLFWFAIYVGSFLTGAYMLKDLGLAGTAYAALVVMQLVAKVACFGFFGRMADKYGDKPVALLGVFGTALVMLFWFLIRPGTPWPVMASVQLFAGIAWAAVDISFLNIVLDLTKNNTRAMQQAQYATVASVVNVLGSLTGGLLASGLVLSFLPAGWLVTGIPAALFVSFLLRMVAAVPFLSLKEPRGKHEHHLNEILHNVLKSVHPRHFFRIGQWK
jgi:MFS family permease